MITASIGSHRFEAGPTYHFNGSNFDALSGVILDPTPTVEYVSALPGVDATPEEIRQVAASGIARLAIDRAELDLLEHAGSVLIDVCDGGTIDQSDFIDRWSHHWQNGRDVFHGYGLSNAVLDSGSVLATRKNKAEETAGLIQEEAPTDEGYFVIGLASSGLITAARTSLQLGEGNHAFGMVRYSRHKSGDKSPNMHPYPESRKRLLKRLADGRQVVVVDEDYTTGKTLKTATDYFAELLDTPVMGIAPVEVERRITYKPLVIKSEQ